MDSAASFLVFRVTVRGRFFELSDSTRAYLVAASDEHDIFKSGFTEEGTFTYDSRIDFFNFRYELRADGVDAQNQAHAAARQRTEQFLKTMRIGFRDLKVTSMDMSAMWDKT